MGKPLVGEVVVLPFPQTDLQVGKRRPALVVADLNGDDLILCQITSQSRRDPYSISLTSTDFQTGRLNVNSFVRANRLFTVDYSFILYSAGKIGISKLAEVRGAIRQLFA
jgi:mRNA-degrading endonuclease toxin of MazEF toxin-antitoxin module